MLFGAHVSIAGGVFNAPINASQIGCEVFQMFTRSPRGGQPAKLTTDTIKQFLNNCKEYNQAEWYVHTPYFINYASVNNRIYNGSISVVREELERASQLKAKYLMTHLGSFKDEGKEKGFIKLINGLDKTLNGYKGSTQFLIEISAGAGSIIGDNFEELAKIINHKKLKKYNIGICYDTQHGFASGYDIRTATTIKKTLENFDKIIGLKNLKLSHINDSMVEIGSNRDRHEHIGEGKIGLTGFKILLKNKKLKNVNFVLETKHDKVKSDLKILKKIRN